MSRGLGLVPRLPIVSAHEPRRNRPHDGQYERTSSNQDHYRREGRAPKAIGGQYPMVLNRGLVCARRYEPSEGRQGAEQREARQQEAAAGPVSRIIHEVAREIGSVMAVCGDNNTARKAGGRPPTR